MGKEQSKFD